MSVFIIKFYNLTKIITITAEKTIRFIVRVFAERFERQHKLERRDSDDFIQGISLFIYFD